MKPLELIPIVGTLTPERTEAITQQLLSLAYNSNNTTPLLLYINSTGGEVGGVKELANLIQNSPRKVIATVGEYCCSAAYWLASQCSEIWAISPTARIGGAGAAITYYQPSENLKTAFGEEITVYAPQSTEKNSEFNALLNGDAEPLRTKILAPLADMLLTDVFAGRATKLADPQDTALRSGSTLYAPEALARGWIDRILGTRLNILPTITTMLNTEQIPTQEQDSEQTTILAQDSTPPTTEQQTEVPAQDTEAPKKEEEESAQDTNVLLTELLKKINQLLEQKESSPDSSKTPPEAHDAPLQSPHRGIPPVSGIGKVVQPQDATLAFAKENADDPLAIIARLRADLQ